MSPSVQPTGIYAQTAHALKLRAPHLRLLSSETIYSQLTASSRAEAVLLRPSVSVACNYQRTVPVAFVPGPMPEALGLRWRKSRIAETLAFVYK
jgi:hypothetical protein